MELKIAFQDEISKTHKFNNRLKKTFIYWIILRFLTWFYAAIVSSYRPFQSIEQIPAWVFVPPVNQWLHRVLIAPWLRWDTHQFLSIVTNGYEQNAGTVQFHPLYPSLARILYWFGAEPLVSLIVVNLVASLVFLYGFLLLSRLENKDTDFFIPILLFLTFPMSFILFSPYSEGLFFCMSCFSLYFVRKGRFGLGGIFGALATLTRQQGIFLIIPIFIELWDAKGRKISSTLRSWKDLISVSLIPFSYFSWILYRILFLNDAHPNFSSFQSLLYSSLLSSNSYLVVKNQAFLWPWKAFSIALHKIILAPDLDIITSVVVAIYMLALIILSWNRLRLSYKLYTFAIVLVSVSYYTGPEHPYMGLPRHMLIAFPIFIGLSQKITKPWLRLSIALGGVLGLLFLLILHLLQIWVP